MSVDPSEWMTPREVAAVLRRSLGTLKQWRYLKKGPPFHLMNCRPIYLRSDVYAFMESCKHADHADLDSDIDFVTKLIREALWSSSTDGAGTLAAMEDRIDRVEAVLEAAEDCDDPRKEFVITKFGLLVLLGSSCGAGAARTILSDMEREVAA